MTSSDVDAGAGTGPPGRVPRRWSLRNWRVRTRLIALIAVPTVVAVALGAVGVGAALSGAAAYGRVGTLAGLAGPVTATVASLQDEQARSAAFVGAGRPAAGASGVADAQRRTDTDSGRLRAAAAAVGDRYPQSTRDRLRRALFRLDTLPALRSAVTVDRLPAGVTVDRYDTVVTDLLALNDEISQDSGDSALSASVRALGALSRAKAALATQRGLLGAALSAGRFEPGGGEALTRAIAAQDGDLQQFRTAATVAQAQSYDDAVAGPDVDQTAALRDGITAGRPPAGGPPAAQAWDAAAAGTLDKVGTVESGLVSAIADRAGQLRTDQVRQAIVVGVLAVVVLLVVLLTTASVARSLVRPLRALRDGALAVAERRLPETVARLGREDPDTVDTRVRPVAVHTTDEIGEVARSFDAVHTEAVRAAVAEARRRAQAGTLFVTLSRRTQSLVDRQIELIDDLEQGEQDADRLDNLFRLDHLATRMRRNGENLLVLGGQEPVRRWNRTLALLDVLRAAQSEIEQYPRIDLDEVPDVAVVEGAVSDVVHLLAELLDNATAFSSRTSRVRVTTTVLPDGSALLEITDRGIGLSEQDCRELDQRLSDPGEADVDVSRRMGLFVVGRLASRLNARVWLSPAEPRGVTASVSLPAAVLTGPPGADPGPAEPAPVPEQAAAADGAWIGERWLRAVETPGPGPDSWFGAAPLHAAGPAQPTAGAEPGGALTFVPTASGTTSAGLPLRAPGTNEVPGALPPDAGTGPTGRHAAPETAVPAVPAPEAAAPDAAAPEAAAPDAEADAADRSPEAIRRRYAGYQRGRRRTDEPGPGGRRSSAWTPGGWTPGSGPPAAGTAAADEVDSGTAVPGVSGTGGTPGGGPPSGAATVGDRTGAPPSPGERWTADPASAAPDPPDEPGTWVAAPAPEPTAAGATSSGLPLRAPGANYVAGSLPDGPANGERAGPGTDPAGDRPAWDRSAEAIRRRFAAHQHGRRRGMERTGE